MVAMKDMTEEDLLHADRVIENAFKLMEDIIKDPSLMDPVPNHSTIELTPIADAIDETGVVARTERFAIKVVSTIP